MNRTAFPGAAAGRMDTARRRRCRSRPLAWAVPKLGVFTLLTCCGSLAPRRPPPAAAAAHATVPAASPAFQVRSLSGVPRRESFLPQEGCRKAAAPRLFRPCRRLCDDELASSCPPRSTSMSVSMSMSSGSSPRANEEEGKGEVRPPTAPASPPPPLTPTPIKRKAGRPKGARNKRRKREDGGGIYRNVGAAELKQLVELKKRLLLDSGGDGGDGSGDEGGNDNGEDDSSVNERVRGTLKRLAAEGGVPGNDGGIETGISSSRGGSTSASSDKDAAGGGSAFPRSNFGEIEEEGFDLRSADDNDDSAQQFGDVDGGLPLDAEIREAEERLRDLRSQQQRYQEDQQQIEGEDELDREAAAMDAAVAAVFGPGKLPSDLLRAGKERERSKRAASQTDPLQQQQEEGALRENNTGEGGQEQDEDFAEEEEEEEEEEEGIEAQEQGEEEQPEEPRMRRIPPVRYRRRRLREAERYGESDAFYTGEDEFEEFVLEDPFEAGEGEGGEDQEDKLPDSWFVMDRLDELLALEPDASGTRLPLPEENLDDETRRLMRMSEDDQSFNPELRQVLVVIGKHLIRDQVTVEYASRIRRLVQGLRSGRLQPDLVCFTGGVVRDNKVADASAGYIYFRHLCEQHKVSTENMGFLVESESTCTKEAMYNVVKEVSRLEREREREELHALEAEGVRGAARPRQRYHFTLISNEYHLSRIIMVHQISEGVSLLAPLKQLQASWGYEQVAYPYACYSDETKKFQADVYKTLEELVPLQVNVQAVASREEFFQEENYAALAHVRERLDDFIRLMQSSRGSRARNVDLEDIERTTQKGSRGKSGMFPAAGGGASGDVSIALVEALQWAAGALDKIQEIIEPAATRRNSVSLRAWAMCAALLERAILQAQMSADPDRPLTPAEWGALEDEKPPPEKVDEEKLIALRARDRALAHLEEMEEKDAAEEDFTVPQTRQLGGAGGSGGGRSRGGGGVGVEERMLDMLTPRRRGQEVDKMTMHWAGADARKDLSLEDEDDPFDDAVPPWRGRLTPIDVPDEGFEGTEEGSVRGLGTRTQKEEEEDGGGSAVPQLRSPGAQTPPQLEEVGDDQPPESPSKSQPVKKRRRGRPRKKVVAPTE